MRFLDRKVFSLRTGASIYMFSAVAFFGAEDVRASMEGEGQAIPLIINNTGSKEAMKPGAVPPPPPAGVVVKPKNYELKIKSSGTGKPGEPKMPAKDYKDELRERLEKRKAERGEEKITENRPLVVDESKQFRPAKSESPKALSGVPGPVIAPGSVPPPPSAASVVKPKTYGLKVKNSGAPKEMDANALKAKHDEELRKAIERRRQKVGEGNSGEGKPIDPIKVKEDSGSNSFVNPGLPVAKGRTDVPSGSGMNNKFGFRDKNSSSGIMQDKNFQKERNGAQTVKQSGMDDGIGNGQKTQLSGDVQPKEVVKLATRPRSGAINGMPGMDKAPEKKQTGSETLKKNRDRRNAIIGNNPIQNRGNPGI